MRSYQRFLFPAGVALIVLLGRSASAEQPPAQDVNIVSPLTSNGSVPVEATVKGIVKTRANPALTHVGALASDVVTLSQFMLADGTCSPVSEIRSDGTYSTLTAVPAGKALVLTDVAWTGTGTAGEDVTFSVTADFSTVGGLALFKASDKYDSNGNATRTTSMTTGIAFGPGVSVCFRAFGGNSAQAYAHGYYVDVP